jgi:hypothetical protein
MSQNARNFVRPNLDEPLKQYFEYDGSNRLTMHAEVTESAQHGAPCLITTYTFYGASARVKLRRETMGTWDSSWET